MIGLEPATNMRPGRDRESISLASDRTFELGVCVDVNNGDTGC